MGGGRGRLGQDGGALWARGALSGKQLRGGEGEVSAGPAAAPLGEKGAAGSGGHREARAGRALRTRRWEKGRGLGGGGARSGAGGRRAFLCLLPPSFSFLLTPQGRFLSTAAAPLPAPGGGVWLPPGPEGLPGWGRLPSLGELFVGAQKRPASRCHGELGKLQLRSSHFVKALCHRAGCSVSAPLSLSFFFFPLMSRLQGSQWEKDMPQSSA